ncbi:MAG: galactose ABC transporter substrate-binding protein [Eubacteriales bacterium]|nr:galactose ABC transporter substrate-binding protein [Eubacteriales bacterium]
MKKLLSIGLALTMVLSLVACSGTPTKTETQAQAETQAEAVAETTKATAKKVGVCIYKFDDAFMTTYRNALQSMLEEMGYQVSVMDGNNDQSKQNEQIDTFITQGVDALIINPVMTSSADVLISKVKAANIPTVLINREPTVEQMAEYNKLVYVGCDARQSGTMQGELILDTPNKGDINGDGIVKYVMIEGDPENVDAQYRTEFSVKALTDAGMKVEMLDDQQGMWDREKGQTIAANALAKFGDEIEVIFCNNDDMAIGALQSINSAGRKVNENIYLVGVDALDAAINEVLAGNMTGTVLNDAKGQASGAVKAMEDLLGGKTYQSGSQSIYVNYVKVTPENAKNYQ